MIATFALGTAAGDLTAETFGLGFLNSAILFTVLFAMPGLAYFAFGLNEVAAFWIAYILTRLWAHPSLTGSTSRCRRAASAMKRRRSQVCLPSPSRWPSHMSGCGIGSGRQNQCWRTDFFGGIPYCRLIHPSSVGEHTIRPLIDAIVADICDAELHIPTRASAFDAGQRCFTSGCSLFRRPAPPVQQPDRGNWPPKTG